MPQKKKRRGPGEGFIEELPSGKWRSGFTNGKTRKGKQRKVTATFGTYAEAVLWRNEQLDIKSKGRLVVDSGVLLEQWLDQWLKSMKAHSARNSLLIYERITQKYLIPELGDCRLNQLDPLLIEQMVGRLAERGVSSADMHKSVKVLRQSLKDAVRLKMLYANPADRARLPRVVRKEMRCWTRDEAQRFLASSFGHRLYPLWALALDTGMRQGELLALCWGDINLDEGYLDVKHTLEEIRGEFRLKEPKTAKSRRRIWLGAAALAALRAIKDRPGPLSKGASGAKVFHTRTNNWLYRDNLCVYLRNAIREAGVPRIRFHDIRHTNATLLLAAGVGIKTVSERLGHANVGITMETYAHVLPGEQKAVAAVSGALFAPVSHTHPTEADKQTEVQVNGISPKEYEAMRCDDFQFTEQLS